MDIVSERLYEFVIRQLLWHAWNWERAIYNSRIVFYKIKQLSGVYVRNITI